MRLKNRKKIIETKDYAFEMRFEPITSGFWPMLDI